MGPVVVRRHCLAEGIMLSWEMHQLLFSVSLYRSSINFFLIMSHFVHRVFIGFSSAVTNTMLSLASLLISTEISHTSHVAKLSAKQSFCKIFCDVLLYEYYSPTVAIQAQVVLLPRSMAYFIFKITLIAESQDDEQTSNTSPVVFSHCGAFLQPEDGTNTSCSTP